MVSFIRKQKQKFEVQKFYGQLYYTKLKHDRGEVEARKYMEAFNAQHQDSRATIIEEDFENSKHMDEDDEFKQIRKLSYVSTF